MKTCLLLTFSLIFLFLLSRPAFASYLYLTPDAASLEKDSTFAVQVNLNTQDEVLNGVSSYLTFPQDKLEALSVQINKAILPIVAEESVDGNVIKLSGGNFSSLSGSELKIGTVNFKAKASGNALINFIAGSAAPRTTDSVDSLNLAASKNASLQIKDTAGTETISTPTSAPGERKVFSCQAKEASNKSLLSSISKRFADLKARFDTIFVLVDDYYTGMLVPDGKAPAGYLGQRQQVEAKRSLALAKLNTFNDDFSSFSCSAKNPREALNRLKSESQAAKTALKEYQAALQSLVRSLR